MLKENTVNYLEDLDRDYQGQQFSPHLEHKRSTTIAQGYSPDNSLAKKHNFENTLDAARVEGKIARNSQLGDHRRSVDNRSEQKQYGSPQLNGANANLDRQLDQ